MAKTGRTHVAGCDRDGRTTTVETPVRAVIRLLLYGAGNRMGNKLMSEFCKATRRGV
jgi:hypothetical protein